MANNIGWIQLKAVADRLRAAADSKLAADKPFVQQEVFPIINELKRMIHDILEQMTTAQPFHFAAMVNHRLNNQVMIETKRSFSPQERLSIKLLTAGLIAHSDGQSTPDWNRISHHIQSVGFKRADACVCISMFNDCVTNFISFMKGQTLRGLKLSAYWADATQLTTFSLYRLMFDIDLKPFLKPITYLAMNDLKKKFLSIRDKLLIENQLHRRSEQMTNDESQADLILYQFLTCFAFVAEDLELSEILIKTLIDSEDHSAVSVTECIQSYGFACFTVEDCKHEFRLMTARYVLLLNTCASLSAAQEFWPPFRDIHSFDFRPYFRSDILSRIESARNLWKPKHHFSPQVLNKFFKLKEKLLKSEELKTMNASMKKCQNKEI